jgi:DNA-binding NtrC family response regulator
VEAAGGTLLLDEVGELPPAAQVKLLRAIQDGEVEPVGARKPVKVDVRLISATNRDLIADVKSGRFREDLFYRLHVFPIAVPPLAERPEDIPELARHFLARFAAEEGKRIRGLDPHAMALLAAYHWPGNVRQLENAMFRAVVLAEGDTIGVGEFPQIAAQLGRDAAVQVAEEVAVSPASVQTTAPTLADMMSQDGSSIPPTPNFAGMLALLDDHGEVRALDELEAEVIRFAISHYRGQMSEIARRLQIGRSTLYRKLDALGLGQRLDDQDHDPVVAG